MKTLTCKRKLLSLIVVIVFAFSLGTTSYALDNSKDVLYEQAQLIAESYMLKSGESDDLQNPIELYNFNDEVAALFFASNDVGYVIVNLNDFSVPEYSVESNNLFIVDHNTKYYYNGPLTYLKQVGDQLLDIPSNEILGNIQEVKTEIDNQVEAGILSIFGSEKLQNAITIRSSRLASALDANIEIADIRYISGTVPNYSYNTGTICAATSSAMYLRYYANYINSKYVPTNLQSSDGVLLINHLTSYIPGNAIPYQVLSGLWSYLSAQGASNNLAAESASTTPISASVANNKPYIMLINNHPTYGNHYVTGYGYDFDYNDTNYAIVNNGWGSTGIKINLGYANTVIYQV